MLTWEEIESRAIAFAKQWKNCEGNERQEAATYEKDLMNVFGVDWHEGLHEYQIRNIEGKLGYIDYLLPSKILIEMKSKGESLTRAYNQGYDYCKCLSPDEYPEILLVSDFEYIQVTNLKTMQTFKKFKINQLKNHIRMLGTLAGYTSEVTFKTDIEVNVDASYKMANLHDGLYEKGYQGKELEIYLVRLLFCLFAEDTGIFEKGAFQEYIQNSKEDGSDLSSRLMELFWILDTPTEKRMSNLREELKKFRYINGKLFSVALPPASFDKNMRKILLDCSTFDWSYISPAIFGAMFQGVMDEEQRREMGAHYTSEENILKLIKPLFLDSLWDEFEHCKSIKSDLIAFHEKLANLKFLDPACGCGNFLIITYREIRLLEFEVLKMLYDNTNMILIDTLCKININQFFGIEYEEFPCQIAQVGLLLMKHQLDREVSNYFGMNLIDFPIKESATIVHGNALKLDWRELVSPSDLSYIIGNPPFVGYSLQNPQQKQDMVDTLRDKNNKPIRLAKKLDYVSAWFYKAAEFIYQTNVMCAFVSTNSITQGEQVAGLWKVIMEKYYISINFAYKPFKWDNEAKGKAQVHCVIIGFSFNKNFKKKMLIDDTGYKLVKNINPYLLDCDNIFIENRRKPICNVPEMSNGNRPTDDGNLIIQDSDYQKFIEDNPLSKKYIKKFIGSKEYINNLNRWCLWLVDADPAEINKCKLIKERINQCRIFRESSSKQATRDCAATASLFQEIRQPKDNYIVLPVTTSENRRYIPIGFVSPEIICSNALMIIPNATLYHFGILISNVHMAWMRAFTGRMKSDYQYSASIVYNNFPWPEVTERQKQAIEEAAQNILDVRSLHKNNSLAELYNPLTMPADLVKAHRHLDKEVCKAYGKIWKSEEECIVDLVKMYQNLISSNGSALEEVAVTSN